ncbi:MAG: PQQ-like beta-propeller repeat protein [Fuerstiella sp.]|jgi:outer membrane protein assembly factor BamB|nr:PQQ-like beta-propeller repeat protein [Fuerstiella sp.]
MTYVLRLLFAVMCCAAWGAAVADDWPQWLGRDRDSHWRESGIVETFTGDGPALRWTTKIKGGYSGPSVAAERVFVMDWIPDETDTDEVPHEDTPSGNQNFVRKRLPGQERVFCLRESDGKVLWSHRYDCPYSSVATYAIGPRTTPTVDHNRVYTVGAEGNLLCLHVSDGSVVWSIDFKHRYGLEVPNWGIASSPLIDGDRLICIAGGKGSTCVALDKRTGKELWRAITAPEPGYSSPMIYTIAGQRQLIVWDSHSVNALDPESGELFWTVPFEATYAMSVATPRVENRSLFVMSYNRRSGMIEVGTDGRSAALRWTGGPRTGIGGVHNTAFLHEGHIYACGNNGQYICARVDSGERVWSTFQPASRIQQDPQKKHRPVSWGNVFTVRHADRFFLANDIGDLIIARMSPQGYEEISRANLIEPTHQVVGGRKLVWSHPAFANRSIYLRNDKEIRCYSLAAVD